MELNELRSLMPILALIEDMEERINRIKEILVIKGKSQKWLAEQMGISTTAMTLICSNKSQPHLKDLKRMAGILEVDIRELLVSTK